MILFIPNFAVMYSDKHHYVPRPDYDFLLELSNYGMSFRVLSFELGKEDPFSDYPLEHIRNLKLRSMGRFDGKASGAGKIMFYMRGIAISVCEVIRHKGLIYIYYPGHFPMIAGLLGALLKKP